MTRDALAVSLFTSRIAPPARRDLSWQELAAWFADPCRTPCTVATCRGSACAHKEGGCWSPAVFRGDRRSAQDVEAVSCLVLDVDGATDARVDALRSQLSAYQHLIHTTHADRREARCLRVVLQLSRPVAAGDWRQFWDGAMVTLAAAEDDGAAPVPTRACSDAARLYYLPSRPSDADYFVATHNGAPLDVDAAIAVAAALVDRPATAHSPAQEGAAP